MFLVAADEEPHQLEHFLRVGLSARDTYGEDAGLVGLLHDLVEDDWTTAERLSQAGFPQHVIDAVVELTRTGEPYEEYIQRVVSGSGLARAVKVCDLHDNIARKPISPKHEARYRKALELLAPLAF